MKASVLTQANVDYLDHLFNWPQIRPVPAQFLSAIPQNDLSLWCLKRAIYQVPTIELIEFLASFIEPATTALEIGAGAGHIGRALKIPMTDNKMQEWPQIQARYRLLKQPTISYGPDVETSDALAAVVHHGPQLVLGCWVTEKHLPGQPTGNMYGIDERAMLAMPSVDTYILVGNRHVHGDKSILNDIPFTRYQFDWLYSRSMEKGKNAIWIFKP